MPRLLVLSPWFPFPADNGSRQRALLLLNQISRGYCVELIAGAQADSPPDVPAPLAALCAGGVTHVPWRWPSEGRGNVASLLAPVPRAVTEGRNPTLADAVLAALARRPDAVLVLQRGMDAFLPDAAFRDQPILLDEVEVCGWDALRMPQPGTGARERLRRRLTYEKARRYWPRRLRRYAALTAVSEAEARAVRCLLGEGKGAPPVVVAPNGVDMSAYPMREAAEIVPGRLIYPGSLTYGPNRDAVRWFVREMLPRVAERVPEAHLVVTGRYEDEDAAEFVGNRRVELTGSLPELGPTLATAAACVVPLRRAGGGTRVKILQAWATGVPVVSTTLGAAGLDGARDGAHLLVRDEAAAFADAVAELLQSPDDARQMAGRARQLTAKRYDAAVVAAPLLDLLERVRG